MRPTGTTLLETGLLHSVNEHIKLDKESYFFASRPGINRVNGRLELVYDDWLYPVFESAGFAELRSRWLGRALAKGPVRVVVKGSEGPVLEGTAIDLRLLGYRPNSKLPPYFYNWVR